MSERQLTDWMRFRAERDCEVVICFYGPVTQKGIEKIQGVLELSKDTFKKAEEPTPEDLDSSRPPTEANGVDEESLPQ